MDRALAQMTQQPENDGVIAAPLNSENRNLFFVQDFHRSIVLTCAVRARL